MKIQHKTSVNHRVAWTVAYVSLSLLVVCGVIYLITGSLFGWKPFGVTSTANTSGNNPASQDQINAGSGVKQNALQSGKNSGSDQPSQPTTQSDGRQLVEVDITGVNKTDSVTRVGVLISDLDSSGTCAITVTSPGSDVLYTTTVGVQAGSNTSTCKGFNIPNSALTTNKYSISIDYNSGQKYGSAIYDTP